jgi:hypothetical protein
MDTTTKTEEAVMETTQNPSPSDINDWDFEEGPFGPPQNAKRDPFDTLRENPFEEEAAMFTVIEIHTNESVKVNGDPVLFDTEEQARDWLVKNLYDGRGFAIVDTEDVIAQSDDPTR